MAPSCSEAAVIDISEPPVDAALAAKRAAILAKVAAAREGEPADAEDPKAVAAKLAAIAASVSAARLASAAPLKEAGGSARKVTATDLFGLEGTTLHEETQNFTPEVKEYRMQGNYGATKFIKP
jgi:hypothetical protein